MGMEQTFLAEVLFSPLVKAHDVLVAYVLRPFKIKNTLKKPCKTCLRVCRIKGPTEEISLSEHYLKNKH